MRNETTQLSIGWRLTWIFVFTIAFLFMTTRNSLAQAGGTHVVAAGETLTAIARRYQTDVNTLMRLNTIGDPSLIRVGQTLVVPSGVVGSGAGRTESIDLAPQESLSDSDLTRIYIAYPGDTLSTVAARFRTTTARLAEMNQRSPSAMLHVGEALRVPVTEGATFTPQVGDDIPVAGKHYVHIVQEGETIAAIANAYGTSQRRTLELNRIADARQVKPGQRIVVPPPSFAEIFANVPMGANGVPQYPVVPTEDKWISIDLDYQRAYAWEGNKLIKRFAISSGKAKTPTVTGVFRTWAKVSSQTMQGGSRAAGDYYNLPNVQWVQYFYRDYAMHGAYWHNKFGTPTSHGCVNLTNSDAKWLFDWASPTVSYRGWHFMDSSNPGTLVVVHR
ncbi:MAG: LysM peptidoglycan-binding domain-containing protein [Caldilinea sp.]